MDDYLNLIKPIPSPDTPMFKPGNAALYGTDAQDGKATERRAREAAEAEDVKNRVADEQRSKPEYPEPREGDYTDADDGFPHCGVCHEARVSRIPIVSRLTGGLMQAIRPRQCACDRAPFEAREKASLEAARKQRMEPWRYVEISRVDWNGCTFESDDRKIPALSEAMKRYCDKYQEVGGLLLYGDVGTGKTFYTACIANELEKRGATVLFTNMYRITTALFKAQDKLQLLDGINGFDFVILDDLGTERKSEWMFEHIKNVIDLRYVSKRPLICTTNIPMEEIKNPADIESMRIYDRVLEMCHPVAVKGESRRRKKVVQDYNRKNTLLGL